VLRWGSVGVWGVCVKTSRKGASSLATRLFLGQIAPSETHTLTGCPRLVEWAGSCCARRIP
jgi:hypothetical protein